MLTALAVALACRNDSPTTPTSRNTRKLPVPGPTSPSYRPMPAPPPTATRRCAPRRQPQRSTSPSAGSAQREGEHGDEGDEDHRLEGRAGHDAWPAPPRARSRRRPQATIGTAVPRSTGTRRAYVTAAEQVPTTEASLLVPSSATTGTCGSTSSSAGSWTSPPPPTTASSAAGQEGERAQRQDVGDVHPPLLAVVRSCTCSWTSRLARRRPLGAPLGLAGVVDGVRVGVEPLAGGDDLGLGLARGRPSWRPRRSCRARGPCRPRRSAGSPAGRTPTRRRCPAGAPAGGRRPARRAASRPGRPRRSSGTCRAPAPG